MNITRYKQTIVGMLLAIIAVFVLFSIRQAEAADVSITVINSYSEPLCMLYISPTTDSEWTGQQLYNEQIAVGAERIFTVPENDYDFRTEGCYGNLIQTSFGVPVYNDFVYIVDGRVSETYAPPIERPNTEMAQAIDDVIEFSINDVDQYFANWSANSNLPYERPNLEISWSGNEDAYYRDNIRTIAIDKMFLHKIAQQHGQYIAATILAHEWAHAAQYGWGSFDQDSIVFPENSSRWSLPYDIGYPTPLVVLGEQQADCMAGAYSRDAQSRGLVTREDVNIGRGVWLAISDDMISGREVSYVLNAHGNGASRLQAYDFGYYYGFSACMVYLPVP